MNIEDVSTVVKEIRVQLGRETNKASQVCVDYKRSATEAKTRETGYDLAQFSKVGGRGKDAQEHSVWCQKRISLHPYLFNFCYVLEGPCGSAGRESVCNAGDLGSTPGLGRSPGEGKAYPLQYSGLENSMDCSMGLQRVRHD